jgi:hypothetical protein
VITESEYAGLIMENDPEGKSVPAAFNSSIELSNLYKIYSIMKILKY